MPRALASRRKLIRVEGDKALNHNTLPSTACKRRIQISNSSGPILCALLLQTKTNPVSGNPASMRLGVLSATAQAGPVFVANAGFESPIVATFKTN